MNMFEAEFILKINKIDPLIYSIGPPEKIECYTIQEENGNWITYWWERGLRHSVEIYQDEAKAVSNFLDNVVEIASLNERRTIVLR